MNVSVDIIRKRKCSVGVVENTDGNIVVLQFFN